MNTGRCMSSITLNNCNQHTEPKKDRVNHFISKKCNRNTEFDLVNQIRK